MVNKSSREPKRIQSVQRALDVLAALASSEDGLRLQDLAQRLGLTAAAAHHILATLAASGYAVRTAEPVRYRLGPAPAALAARQRSGRLGRALEAELPALARSLPGCSVSFCEAVGTEVRITRRIEPERPDVVAGQADGVLPPYTSAASMIHLAFWDAERVQTYREQRPFEVYGAQMWRSPEGLAAELERIRREGFNDLPLAAPDVLRIGVPVFGPEGVILASITISARRSDDRERDRTRIAATTIDAAARIRAHLTGANP